jgi:hypothetical protein
MLNGARVGRAQPGQQSREHSPEGLAAMTPSASTGAAAAAVRAPGRRPPPLAKVFDSNDNF